MFGRVTFRFMPFGKHKGTSIEKIPLDYIEWLLSQGSVDGWLRRELEESRDLHLNLRWSEISGNNSVQRIRKVFLECSKKWHPDKGGSVDAMQALNEFNEKLLKEMA